MSWNTARLPYYAKACSGCYYLGGDGHCDFLLINGHPRGCPPGPGCIEKKTEHGKGSDRAKRRSKGLNLISGQTKRRERNPGVKRLLDGNERVEQMYREGWTDIEIACAMNCSKSTVQKWRARTGLPSNGKQGRQQKETEVKHERSNDHQAQL